MMQYAVKEEVHDYNNLLLRKWKWCTKIIKKKAFINQPINLHSSDSLPCDIKTKTERVTTIQK